MLNSDKSLVYILAVVLTALALSLTVLALWMIPGAARAAGLMG
jgi:hypothetical protein